MIMGCMDSDRVALTGRYVRAALRYRAVVAGMIICMVMVGALEPLLVWLLAPLLDSAVADKQYILPTALLPLVMVLLVFCRSAFIYGRAYLGGWLDVTLQREFRAAMAAQLAQLPAAQIQRDTQGRLTSRFMVFLPKLTSSTLPVCVAMVQEPIKIIAYVALMLYWQWQLAIIVLLVAPIVALMVRYLSRRMRRAAAAAQQYIALGQNRLNESIQLWQIIKLQGAERAQGRLRNAFGQLRGAMLKVSIVLCAGQPITHFLLALPFAVVVYYAVGALQAGEMSAGEVASFITIMLLLPGPVRSITRAVNTWEEMLVAAREIFGFLDAAGEPDDGTRQLGRARGEIVFDDICFGYSADAPPVLRGVSLTVAAKETVALVGRSGAGKTTLANLLPRFYEADSGAARLDGVDIRELTLESLRNQIALVTQKPLLFDDTVAMNVAYPDEAADERRVWAALQDAAADEFVRALPDGAQTRIGADGERLSGGQRQRLALARAFYKDAPVVILDEATSALDSETEMKIKEAMRRLFVGRTAIIIAHRFATIDFADRVVVLDGGRVIAAGASDDLRQSCPLYADLYNAQLLRAD